MTSKVAYLSTLIVCLLVPFSASSYTVSVGPPSGADDTARIQAALDECVAYGPGCTVQLTAGTYLTKQLVAYNFRGTLKGLGKTLTILQALPALTVVASGLPSPSNPPPSLLTFVNGQIVVSDLGIKVPTVPATVPWYLEAWDVWFDCLIDGIRITGSEIGKTTGSVERVSVEGARDPEMATGFFGYNIANGITIAGELNITPFEFYPFGGTFKVTGSTVKTVYSGLYPTVLQKSRITFGGSPAAGNTLTKVEVGIDIESLEDSLLEASYNEVQNSTASLWVIPHWYMTPVKPSQFYIHHNTFNPTGQDAEGVELQDTAAAHWIRSVVSNNKIKFQHSAADDFGLFGIGLRNTLETAVTNNQITGTGVFGIYSGGGTGCLIQGNNVQNFIPIPNYVAIFLNRTTKNCTVVGGSNQTNVVNLGTDNIVVGVNNMNGNAPGPDITDALERKHDLIKNLKKPF